MTQSRRRRWPALSAAALLPVLALGALLVPGARGLVDATEVSWYSYVWGVDAFEPGIGTGDNGAVPESPANGSVGIGWGVSVWPRTYADTGVTMPHSPPAPPRPLRPTLPWDNGSSSRTDSTATPPPFVKGPIEHITGQVQPFGTMTIPAGFGQPHILCAGPTTPGVGYWLDSTTAAGTKVHRTDGSGLFDFYYRNVTDHYLQREPCA